MLDGLAVGWQVERGVLGSALEIDLCGLSFGVFDFFACFEECLFVRVCDCGCECGVGASGFASDVGVVCDDVCCVARGCVVFSAEDADVACAGAFWFFNFSEPTVRVGVCDCD